jgi:hypothetical protein
VLPSQTCCKNGGARVAAAGVQWAEARMHDVSHTFAAGISSRCGARSRSRGEPRCPDRYETVLEWRASDAFRANGLR